MMQSRYTQLPSLENNEERGRRSWAEICCCNWACLQLLWPRVVLHKWLNISSMDSDYSADTDTDDNNNCCTMSPTFLDAKDNLPQLRRRNSETIRAQYIHTKEIRVCVGTWNVGGKLPPDNLDIDEWIDINDPADIYVLGLQEIVPLNAGNIIGAEDNRPISQWENIIRQTLCRIPAKRSYKSHSDPPSPSTSKLAEDFPVVENELSFGSDSEGEEEVHPVDEDPIKFYEVRDKLVSSERTSKNPEVSDGEEISFSVIHGVKSSRKQYTSLRRSDRWQSFQPHRQRALSDASVLADLDLKALVQRRRRPEYVRIASKQMVGIFLTIWVRKALRKHIQNLKVSTVGVGVMGYIGNKGAVSVSMSIYQTLFCFICTHLTSGERECDQLKRNADVNEIHRRTFFPSSSGLGVSKSIYDHERIIWFGDLNYRLNLSYDETLQLILQKKWSKLLEFDQLVKEFRKGRVFDGWYEGTLSFPPTYKYEMNSDTYYGEDPKVGRRIPAWCDRILSFGKGLKQLNYRRSEIMLSDHRPVTAMYDVEVEVFCPRKVQPPLHLLMPKWKMKR